MIPAIKIENISKQYHLGLTDTLSHDLKRWWIEEKQVVDSKSTYLICGLRFKILEITS